MSFLIKKFGNVALQNTGTQNNPGMYQLVKNKTACQFAPGGAYTLKKAGDYVGATEKELEAIDNHLIGMGFNKSLSLFD